MEVVWEGSVLPTGNMVRKFVKINREEKGRKIGVFFLTYIERAVLRGRCF